MMDWFMSTGVFLWT
ncbi:hypothetical protein EE612_013530 [Oryza sativa]|nr:hypothetical protein EE612_013530 [Oryza sativa]